PTQMTDLLHRGILDGYCAGEPWNTLAEERGCGKVVIATTELAPDHPEKALVVTRKWQAQNPGNAERLVRATLRGCAFCDDPVNRSRLTEILAGPRYLALPERIIARSLSIDEWLHPGAARPRFRTFASSVLAPTVERIVWIVERMMRWGDLPADTDVPRLAGVCVDLQTFDRAAGALRPGKNHPAPVARASTYMEGSLI
ncbi:MAG TPA: ABC transporter substrate-binding protein, partial [Tepidisphaeraceae bacterium]|nr:ABC transporter substrate-binding protein [Tepidisphaeraceae bacterium]